MLTIPINLSEKVVLEYILQLFKHNLPQYDISFKDESYNAQVSIKRISEITKKDALKSYNKIKENEVVQGKTYSASDLKSIIDLVSSKKKPFILHNGLMDIMHVDNHNIVRKQLSTPASSGCPKF